MEGTSGQQAGRQHSGQCTRRSHPDGMGSLGKPGPSTGVGAESTRGVRGEDVVRILASWS